MTYTKKLDRLFFGLYTKAMLRCTEVPSSMSARKLSSWTLFRSRKIIWRTDESALTYRKWPEGRGIRFISQSTLDPTEVKKFQTLASKWWDEKGEFGALHAMNDLRVPFIRDNLLNVHDGRTWGNPLSGVRILDVGCGGGILTEPLGRLGADVIGLDPVEDSIKTAELHCSCDPVLRERIRYQTGTLEELSEEEAEGFDAVVASELVEHLLDLDTFIRCCYQVLKPGGFLFITTINKTNLSYALAIIMAERVLHIVPPGTHDWQKFISPVALECLLESSGFSVESIRGMWYNPLSRGWSWVESTAVNYALYAVKPKKELSPECAETPANHMGH